jgi:nitrate reductase beta subunit
MRVMAQLAMVMNLDKCLGCHTCSVTCKQAWTNRTGMEHVWFNNVETRPGLGYPRTWMDQVRWKGGWEARGKGRIELRSGGRLRKLARIFANPETPQIDDYYEPWTYEYDLLLAAPADQSMVPVARPRSLITGDPMKITWSANWDDDLAGSQEIAVRDPLLGKLEEEVRLEYERTFMFYLPRLCEHCLNPACAAACPSGAIYKRVEDGIVLVDQERCRGWRMCVSACPYKKTYYNRATGKAEKCTLCYPRVEVGLSTVCSDTCVGRLRHLGLVLYDADVVAAASAVADDRDLLGAQRACFLDPHDAGVAAAARAAGIPDGWVDAARRSPVWRMITDWEIALPLHPEFRTLPMVWYVPPLSPLAGQVVRAGADAGDGRTLFAAIAQMRIPLQYLAELLAAGDPNPVERSLRRLAAMRVYLRGAELGRPPDEEAAAAVGMTGAELRDLYRALAIAEREDRAVIPTAHAEVARVLEESAGSGEGEP